mgnify:CR=1 FL=1
MPGRRVRLGWLPGHHEEHDEGSATSGEELEKGIVASATRTDLILSAEIMLVSMAGLSNETGIMRVAVLIAVAFFMTFFVYGLVALLVKADDFGLRLAKDAIKPEDNRPGPVDNVGRTIVRVMPHIFNVIGVVGTVAMLWVGGHLVIENLAEVGVPIFHHILEVAEHAVSAAGSFVTWLVETLLSGIFGIVLGAVVAWIVVGISMLGRKVRGRD